MRMIIYTVTDGEGHVTDGEGHVTDGEGHVTDGEGHVTLAIHMLDDVSCSAQA